MEPSGPLSQGTVTNYKSRLRKLLRALPCITDENELQLAKTQIERLANQLGLELSTLEVSLARGPGRKRTTPNLPDLPPEPKIAESEVEKAARLAAFVRSVVDEKAKEGGQDMLEQSQKALDVLIAPKEEGLE